MRVFGVAAGAALVLAAPAAGAVDASGFRYTRELRAQPGPALLEPDGPLYAHTRRDFADLRIVDGAGQQVPWRPAPARDRPRRTAVELLNRGRQGGRAVALIDLGPVRRIHDRIELEVPDASFVGTVEVLGSDDRKRFTRLSRTQIYGVRGARPARSTTAVFPPTDFRYLQLRASGVSTISGATVAFDPSRPQLRTVESTSSTRQRAGATIVSLDLRFRGVPVDALRLETSTERFDRPVTVTAPSAAPPRVVVGRGRVTRFSGVSLTTVPVASRSRYLRVSIANGDDPPLDDLRVTALARPRTILLADGFRPPYRLLYGDPSLAAPKYDFAALPRSELGLERASVGRLGAEARNPDFEPPEDTRSFAARHPALLQGALALAAVAVALGGFLALRRRAPIPS
jgi:Protein of unknown function (DUF3999)